MLHFIECRKKCNTDFGFSIFSHKNQSIKLLPKNLIYRNITTPSLSYAHEHCRNPKKVSKKVATLEKTTFLYRSKSLISLWASDSQHLPPPPLTQLLTVSYLCAWGGGGGGVLYPLVSPPHTLPLSSLPPYPTHPALSTHTMTYCLSNWSTDKNYRLKYKNRDTPFKQN